MIHKPPVDWFALSPELSLLAAVGLLLLIAVLVPRSVRRPVSAGVCLAGFATSVVLAVVLADRSENAHGVIANAIVRDRWGALAQVLVAASGLIAIFLSYREPMRD